jgi:hypothetical protein
MFSKLKKLASAFKRLGKSAHGHGVADAEALAHERVDSLDKRRRGDTIFYSGACEGPPLIAGTPVWQQPFQEELCDGYAPLLGSAPCGPIPGRRVS